MSAGCLLQSDPFDSELLKNNSSKHTDGGHWPRTDHVICRERSKWNCHFSTALDTIKRIWNRSSLNSDQERFHISLLFQPPKPQFSLDQNKPLILYVHAIFCFLAHFFSSRNVQIFQCYLWINKSASWMHNNMTYVVYINCTLKLWNIPTRYLFIQMFMSCFSPPRDPTAKKKNTV